MVKIGGKLGENLIISGWTFARIGVKLCQFKMKYFCSGAKLLVLVSQFQTFLKDEHVTLVWIAKRQIFSKQTQMFHEEGFLSQKKPACQAFSMLLAKRPPRVLLKQANTPLRNKKYSFLPRKLWPKILLKFLNFAKRPPRVLRANTLLRNRERILHIENLGPKFQIIWFIHLHWTQIS